MVDPLDGRLADPFPAGQLSGRDAVMVTLVELPAVRLAAVPPLGNPRQIGNEALATGRALQTTQLNDQFGTLAKAVQMFDPARVTPLAAGPRGPAARALIELPKLCQSFR